MYAESNVTSGTVHVILNEQTLRKYVRTRLAGGCHSHRRYSHSCDRSVPESTIVYGYIYGEFIRCGSRVSYRVSRYFPFRIHSTLAKFDTLFSFIMYSCPEHVNRYHTLRKTSLYGSIRKLTENVRRLTTEYGNSLGGVAAFSNQTLTVNNIGRGYLILA